MNKAELIEVVAARIDASKKDAAEAVQAVVDAIQEAVATGQKVSISGFGVFEKASRPARTYRKPSTGEAIRKMATSVPKFRPGGDFKAFVSGEKNIADAAVKAARDAGEGVSAAAGNVVEQAGNVVEQALAAVGRPTRKAAATAQAAAEAPAKRAPAKRAPAKRTPKPAPAPAEEVAAPAAAVPAAQAPAEEAPVQKAAAKRAPAKRTAKVAAAPEAAPVKRAPAKRTAKKAAPAPQAPAAEG
jgi:DNA-binding protein HU-beta